MPPEPRGPLPPLAVTARQLGDRVEVSFQAPPPRGDRPAQQPASIELVRVEFRPGVEPPGDADVFRRRGTVVASRGFAGIRPGDEVRIDDETWSRLEPPGPGWTLRYAVRVRDRRGRPSPLVVARDVVSEAIQPPPTGLTGEATADGIRLSWQPPSGAGPFRYNVYRTIPGRPWPSRPLQDQPSTGTDYLDATVTTGVRYLYTVRVALVSEPPYRESASSDTIELLAADRFPPAPPTGLVPVQEGPSVRLFWDPNRERDLAGYHVLRRRSDGENWQRLNTEPIRETMYLDRDVQPGQRLDYAVQAVDRASPPNLSEPSEPVTIHVVADPAGDGGPRP